MIDPSLIERVRSGEGADIDLDARIFDALSRGTVGSAHQAVIDRRKRPDWLPAYTSSLDAVVSLTEEKIGVSEARDLLQEALDEMGVYGFCDDKPMGPQIARAMLAHLLLALSAKDADHD